MGRLNKRELKLLVLCLGSIFLIGNMILFRHFMEKVATLDIEVSKLKQDIQVSQIWIDDEVFWAEKKLWLDEKMPRGASVGSEQGKFLKKLQESAYLAEIVIEKQSLQNPINHEHYQEVSVQLNVIGPEVDVYTWLATMQAPDKFQDMKRLTILLDKKEHEDGPYARCEFTLSYYFKPES